MARTSPKNRYERCVQVMRWLIEEYPENFEPGTITLVWKESLGEGVDGREALYGATTETKHRIVIALSARSCRTTAQAVETMLHEAAHAWLWETGRGLLHGPEFWQVYGQIIDAYDHHGWQDSKSYFVD